MTTPLPEDRPVVRLTVNLAPSVADLLTELSTMDGLNVTEGVREAVVCYHDARRGPHPHVRHAVGAPVWCPPAYIPRAAVERLQADFAERSCTITTPGDVVAECLDAAYADAAEHLDKLLAEHPAGPALEVPPSHPWALQPGAPVHEARAAAVRYYEAAVTMSAEIEDTLAPALGFEPYPPGSPGYSPDRVNYVTGDHVAESLALTAARQLTAAREVLATGKHDDACALAKEASAGETCSCWKADLARALDAPAPHIR